MNGRGNRRMSFLGALTFLDLNYTWAVGRIIVIRGREWRRRLCIIIIVNEQEEEIHNAADLKQKKRSTQPWNELCDPTIDGSN